MSAEELGFDPTLKKKKKKVVSEAPSASASPAPEKESLDDLFAGAKKKKKKTKAKKEATDDNDNTDELTESFEGLKLKKKKKKKGSKASESADFEKALAAAGVQEEDSGKLYDERQKETFIPYITLLDRFYDVLREKNPEMAGGQHQKLKIPPPEVARDGNKKTVFVNVQVIAHVLQRNPEHLIQYLFAELGTSGSIDGEKRLVIKGRFQAKNIESVLRRYIQEYVICKTCKSMNTELKRESTNRLHFIVCKACGSTKSVSSIKTGYQAHIGANRRKRV
ncbi:DEKNAAC100710 [Brettanomyces naardenensis]|uniref:DEKNAAC100710 n=1 Tax=Brettanomyces naardenensis TaxID=13370 RepID=A0A448YFS7_BRENA|nr:DEKNAAC100710 [Brettanomyces naardenensis]